MKTSVFVAVALIGIVCAGFQAEAGRLEDLQRDVVTRLAVAGRLILESSDAEKRSQNFRNSAAIILQLEKELGDAIQADRTLDGLKKNLVRGRQAFAKVIGDELMAKREFTPSPLESFFSTALHSVAKNTIVEFWDPHYSHPDTQRTFLNLLGTLYFQSTKEGMRKLFSEIDELVASIKRGETRTDITVIFFRFLDRLRIILKTSSLKLSPKDQLTILEGSTLLAVNISNQLTPLGSKQGLDLLSAICSHRGCFDSDLIEYFFGVSLFYDSSVFLDTSPGHEGFKRDAESMVQNASRFEEFLENASQFDHLLFYNYLGMLYLKNKQTQEAIRIYEKSLHQFPDSKNYKNLFNLALTYLDLENHESAIKILKRLLATENNPSLDVDSSVYSDARRIFTLLLFQEDYDSALAENFQRLEKHRVERAERRKANHALRVEAMLHELDEKKAQDAALAAASVPSSRQSHSGGKNSGSKTGIPVSAVASGSGYQPFSTPCASKGGLKADFRRLQVDTAKTEAGKKADRVESPTTPVVPTHLDSAEDPSVRLLTIEEILKERPADLETFNHLFLDFETGQRINTIRITRAQIFRLMDALGAISEPGRGSHTKITLIPHQLQPGLVEARQSEMIILSLQGEVLTADQIRDIRRRFIRMELTPLHLAGHRRLAHD